MDKLSPNFVCLNPPFSEKRLNANVFSTHQSICCCFHLNSILIKQIEMMWKCMHKVYFQVIKVNIYQSTLLVFCMLNTSPSVVCWETARSQSIARPHSGCFIIQLQSQVLPNHPSHFVVFRKESVSAFLCQSLWMGFLLSDRCSINLAYISLASLIHKLTKHKWWSHGKRKVQCLKS